MSTKKKKKYHKKNIAGVLIKVIISLLLVALLAFAFLNIRPIIQKVQFLIAEKELSEGDDWQAVNTYRYAIKTYRENSEAYSLLGNLYSKLDLDYYAKLAYETGYQQTANESLKNKFENLSMPEDDVEATPVFVSKMKESEFLPRKVITEVANNKRLQDVVSSTTEYVYDENGNVITIEENDSDGNFISRNEYEYNENGRLISSKKYEARFSKEYSFSEDGLLISEEGHYFEDNAKTVIVRNVDIDGFLATSEDGNYAIRYTYDDNKKVISAEFESNDTNRIITNEYDKKGVLSKRIDSSIEYIYAFNESSKVVSISWNNSETERNTENYYYDDAGHLIEISCLTETLETIETKSSNGKTKITQEWIPGKNKDTQYSYLRDLTESELYYEDGELLYSYTYVYNSDDSLSKEVYYNYSAPSISYVTDYAYRLGGRKESSSVYYPHADKQVESSFQYNIYGQLDSELRKFYGTELSAVDEDKNISYTYDDSGRVISEVYYFVDNYNYRIEEDISVDDGIRYTYVEIDPMGKEIQKVCELYDNSGKILVKVISDMSTGSISQYEKYTYDNYNDLIEVDYYSELAQLLEEETYNKDEDGFFSSKCINRNGKKSTVEKYSYDENGYLLRKTDFQTGDYCIYGYDEDYRLMNEKIFGKNNDLLYAVRYEYD